MAPPRHRRRIPPPLRVLLGLLTLAVVIPASPVAAQQIADEIQFEDQPEDTEAGQTIPTVTVEARWGPGFRDFNFNQEVTIALGANPGGGTLSGTLTVTAENGLATFN